MNPTNHSQRCDGVLGRFLRSKRSGDVSGGPDYWELERQALARGSPRPWSYAVTGAVVAAIVFFVLDRGFIWLTRIYSGSETTQVQPQNTFLPPTTSTITNVVVIQPQPLSVPSVKELEAKTARLEAGQRQLETDLKALSNRAAAPAPERPIMPLVLTISNVLALPQPETKSVPQIAAQPQSPVPENVLSLLPQVASPNPAPATAESIVPTLQPQTSEVSRLVQQFEARTQTRPLVQRIITSNQAPPSTVESPNQPPPTSLIVGQWFARVQTGKLTKTGIVLRSRVVDWNFTLSPIRTSDGILYLSSAGSSMTSDSRIQGSGGAAQYDPKTRILVKRDGVRMHSYGPVRWTGKETKWQLSPDGERLILLNYDMGSNAAAEIVAPVTAFKVHAATSYAKRDF